MQKNITIFRAAWALKTAAAEFITLVYFAVNYQPAYTSISEKLIMYTPIVQLLFVFLGKGSKTSHSRAI